MKVRKIVSVLLMFVLTPGLWAGSAPINKTIHVTDPFARAAPSVVKNGAAYMTLHNHGETALVLTGVRGEVAKRIEMHQSLMSNGIMKMPHVDKVIIPAYGTVQFMPGGYHIMLMGLQSGLKEGDRFPLTLQFGDGSERRIEVPVRGLGAMPMPMQHSAHEYDSDHSDGNKHDKQHTKTD